MLIARAGEEIVCPKGTVCGRLTRDANDQIIDGDFTARESSSSHADQRYVCACCGRPVAVCRVDLLESASPPWVGAIVPQLDQIFSVTKAFQTPILACSLGQLATSFGGFFATCTAMYLCLAVSLWITLPMSALAAGFLVRIFIIQHDCGHGSFFKSRWANELIGSRCSLMTLMPYAFWRRQHAKHHGSWNNLDRRASSGAGVDAGAGGVGGRVHCRQDPPPCRGGFGRLCDQCRDRAGDRHDGAGNMPLVAAMGAAGLLGGMIMPSRDMLVRAAAPPGAIGRTFGIVTGGFSIGGMIGRRCSALHRPRRAALGVRRQRRRDDRRRARGAGRRPPLGAPPAVRGSGVGGSDHRIGQAADLLDPQLDHVARLEEFAAPGPDAGGRAGEDHVAGIKRDAARQLRDLLGQREDHLPGIRILLQHVVDPESSPRRYGSPTASVGTIQGPMGQEPSKDLCASQSERNGLATGNCSCLFAGIATCAAAQAGLRYRNESTAIWCDSWFRGRARRQHLEGDREFADLPLEGDGFEPSVPVAREPVYIAEGELRGDRRAAKKIWRGTEGSNPSPSSGEFANPRSQSEFPAAPTRRCFCLPPGSDPMCSRRSGARQRRPRRSIELSRQSRDRPQARRSCARVSASSNPPPGILTGLVDSCSMPGPSSEIAAIR